MNIVDSVSLKIPPFSLMTQLWGVCVRSSSCANIFVRIDVSARFVFVSIGGGEYV